MIIENLFSRQGGIIKPAELAYHVLIIGAGGIGSWTALALLKLGVSRISILDFDKIEEVNLAPQFYNSKHNGMYKVEALVQRLTEEALPGQTISGIQTKWEEWTAKEEYISTEMVDVVIMAVDSMDVRIKIWNDIKHLGLLGMIDGRMAREMLEIFVIDPVKQDQVEFFEKHLFASSTVDHIPCTERAVAYNQFVIAGLIGSTFKQFAKKELEYKRILLDLFSLSLISQ